MWTNSTTLAGVATAVWLAAFGATTTLAQSTASKPEAQSRPAGVRVMVPVAAVAVDDGDTVSIRWSASDLETVRILGIDTPETRHVEHDLPYDQAFGPEARAFARGVFAKVRTIEILRATMTDPFGRTLAYLFLDGHNYSVTVVTARLAAESISQFGDNGFPAEAAAVLAAAKTAGPLALEPPHIYRARMRALTTWLKSKGLYPP
ncbi:MAG: hypothetical protein EXQ51_05240 [Acidobacteria bacterium]|nr:hypothetical protein [Acidobacteriota bacterium]